VGARRVVKTAHTASYADPIRLAAGAEFALTGREDIWDGHRWLWAVAEDGREGWIPDNLVRTVDGRPVAAHAYWAIELSCNAGDPVTLMSQTHGWGWCRSHDGAEGWLPLDKLRDG